MPLFAPGVTIATAAALAVAGAAAANPSPANMPVQVKPSVPVVSIASLKAATRPLATDTVACGGINSCRGQGNVKVAEKSCGGENPCSKKGVVSVSRQACDAGHGQVVAIVSPGH